MRTLRNIGISLLVVGVLGGAAFLALRSVSKSPSYGSAGQHSSGTSTGSVGTHGVMTETEERSVRLGTTKTAVVARFGTPASTDAQELTGCVYYRMPHTILHTWQLCFTDGRLASKSRA